MKADIEISIHAPREGCDVRTRSPSWWASDFNPRTPRGVRRLKSYLSLALDGEFQSTHPARGATSSIFILSPVVANFNPRTPRGVRPNVTLCRATTTAISIHAPREGCDVKHHFYHPPKNQFQSTHPARGATGQSDSLHTCRRISIHAPREGCDSKLYQRAESLLGSICLFAQGEEG